MPNETDIKILRELAKTVAEIAAKDVQDERRDLWRRHNEFEDVRPPVLVRGGYERELIEPALKCADPFYRGHERGLRGRILQDTFGDDTIIEPWITEYAAFVTPAEGLWGLKSTADRVGGASLAFHVNAALGSYDDLNKMIEPYHQIDEAKTAESADRIRGAVGDIIDVHVDRSTIWKYWNADISTQLGYLRGHEQLFYDIMDRPGELHKLLAFMRDGILKAQQASEDAGGWSLAEHECQTMPYAGSLKDPKPNSYGTKRNELWGFLAAQEFAGISPEQHYEFLLQYQMPIMENFGFIAYGCCEDLTHKIDMLRKVKNLRRISVTPFADVKKCAEQLRGDYIASYRPNPNIMAVEFDKEYIGKLLGDAMGHFARNGCRADICLKDISTVGGDPGRMTKFSQLAISIAESAYGGV